MEKTLKLLILIVLFIKNSFNKSATAFFGELIICIFYLVNIIYA